MRRSLALLIPLGLLAGALRAGAAPALGPAGTRRILQSQAHGVDEHGDEFGAAVAGGDLDGDGYDDLVVAAPSDAGVGALFVYPGSAAGLTTGSYRFESDAQRGGVNSPEVVGDFFGTALVMGNFDGDPELELVASASGRSGGAGAIFVFQGIAGSGTWFDSSQLGCGAVTAGDAFGASLAVGDFNGDGYDDLAIGAPGASSSAGKICVVPGGFGGLADGTGAAYLQNTNDYTPSLVEAGDRFGERLATGRFTDDAFADLVIGAPGEAPGASPAGGSVAVWFGKDATSIGDFFSSGVAFIESDSPAQAVENNDEFGTALATAAVSGSADRLYIGASGDPGGLNHGLVTSFNFYFGSSTWQPGFFLSQESNCCDGSSETGEDGDQYGNALATTDVDGNGFDELLVGVPSEDGGAGMVMFYSDNSLAGFALAQSYRIADLRPNDGPHAGSFFGEALASGDFNGDGRGEFVIGAPVDEVGGISAGAVYVVPEPIGSAPAAAALFVLAALGAGSRLDRAVRNTERRSAWPPSRPPIC